MDKHNSDPKSSKSKPEAGLPVNKKLSRSMLHMPAIQIVPPLIELELNEEEASSALLASLKLAIQLPVLIVSACVLSIVCNALLVVDWNT